ARESKFGLTLTDAREHIDEVCHTIDLKVAIRTRWLQYKHFQQANQKNTLKGKAPWYRRWVLEGGEGGPKVDDYEQESGEQVDVHPILKNISPDVYMRLAKAADHCPGLELKPGTHRRYPFGRAGAQLMGQLAPVTKQDLDADPNFDADTLQKELRKYEPTDLIGRGGLEGLCEPTLRGSRGRLLSQIGKEDEPLDAPVQGEDVRSTIDIALQGEIQDMFAHLMIPDNRYGMDDEKHYIPCPMHGAAVVIDVKSGEV